MWSGKIDEAAIPPDLSWRDSYFGSRTKGTSQVCPLCPSLVISNSLASFSTVVTEFPLADRVVGSVTDAYLQSEGFRSLRNDVATLSLFLDLS